MSIPKAKTEIPKSIIKSIKRIGSDWIEFNKSNLFDVTTLKHWNLLIGKWANDPNLPLVVRNARATRGGVVTHKSGREIIFCDNSPAKWVAEKVFEKYKPSILQIRNLINSDLIPYKFASSKSEQDHAKYKCVSKNDLNRAGWKLCHIENVGLKKQKNFEDYDIKYLKRKIHSTFKSQ